MTEKDRAFVIAERVLDRISADPDDDLAILSRQLIRCREAATLAALDVDRLAKALHGTRSICMRPAELCRFDPTGFHHDWAEAIAAEYERTAALVPA